MNPKYFKPELDKKYTIALRYPSPKEVNGFSGRELRWILMDGRAFYTPLDFEGKLKALGVKAGQQFAIEKRLFGRKAEWIVSHVSDSQPEKSAPQKAVQILESAGALDEPAATVETVREAVHQRPETALERALKTAVSAAAEAEKHGAAIGYSIRFKPEDVRALGITVLIGMQSGRAA
jgi:hypothetical protein